MSIVEISRWLNSRINCKSKGEPTPDKVDVHSIYDSKVVFATQPHMAKIVKNTKWKKKSE